MRMQYTILISLKRFWKQAWLIDSRNGVTTCQGGNSRLLDKAFEIKHIKEEGKTPNWHLKAN